jgi:hypothetical protein
MSGTLLNTELNSFCQKYLVTNNGNQNLSAAGFIEEEQRVSSSIFEQLLLFESVCFKVHGENIPLLVLLNKFGVSGLESLLEQGAIKFVLWNQIISHMVDDLPGLDPLQYGKYSSKAHSDPEESIQLSFAWMKEPPKRSTKRSLVRKIRDHYSLPNPDISKNAVALVRSAFDSGKLRTYGLSPDKLDYANLNLANRKLLCGCADELLQYAHLLNEEMTTYDKLSYYQLFVDSGKKINAGLHLAEKYQALSELQGIPDLRRLYAELENPNENLIKIRAKERSKRFRHWLMEQAGNDAIDDISREYIDAIANAQGFFQTRTGKFSKAIAMTTIGGGIGALLAGPIGAAGGATAARILEPLTDLGLDLIDEFVLSGLTNGWTPKMFFDDLERLRMENQKETDC